MSLGPRLLAGLALVATASGFSSTVPSGDCHPIFDCTVNTDWFSRDLNVAEVLNTTKTAAEVWAHISNHEAFLGAIGQSANMQRPGAFEQYGVGAIRKPTDPAGSLFIPEEMIISFVPESHYTYVVIRICEGAAAALAPMFQSCGVTVSMSMLPDNQVQLQMRMTLSTENEELLNNTAGFFTELYSHLLPAQQPYLE